MYGPTPARRVCPPVGVCSGVCELSGSSIYGFFVEYQVIPVQGALPQRAAYVHLLVTDLSLPVSRTTRIRFLIDTGAERTIIPRNLVSSRAFSGKTVGPLRKIEGITGRGPILGAPYFASLVIIPSDTTFEPLKFNRIEVLVTNQELVDAILGQDVLQHLVMISDSQYLSLWSPPIRDKINTMTKAELMNLYGIGEEIAKRIIAKRPFTQVNELLDIKGIGPKTLEKIQEKVTVS